jgi:hypothetical protein
MVERGERTRMLFVGDDWAEDHHDVEIQDENGKRLAKPACRKEFRGSPGSTT